MPNTGTNIDSVNKWRAVSLRLSAFPVEPLNVRQDLMSWEEVTKQKPEISQQEPQKGTLMEAGSVQDSWLSYDTQPLRIDWRLSLKLDQSSIPNELPVLEGKFTDQTEKFCVLMKRWLKRSPPLKRLAFAPILLLPAKDRSDGYRLLNNFLPNVTVDATGSRDILYRINRPRSSRGRIVGLEINRVVTWSVVEMSVMTIDLAHRQSHVVQPESSLTACRLEMDINTVAEFEGRLTRTSLPKLLDEFSELAYEISEEGDLP